VGLTGRLGSGKTSAADYLSTRYGFDKFRYSQVLQDWLSDRTATRADLQSLGWDVMSGGRQAELNAQLISRIDPDRSAVIDGLRHATDFDCLSKAFGAAFQLIFIRTEAPIRILRTADRFTSLAAFEEADRQPVEAHIDSLVGFASATISNNDSLDQFYGALQKIMSDIQEERAT
jgi:dephospho-CoA kinase